ncbi:MAG: response regulator transcription factor [Candidatus Obscuribacterales bacterium]|nr:response regulator transcription factor [Candidatus Obscuribacterales bacterium]
MAKVLFVEDDADLAEKITEFLSREGHVPEHVADGNEGLHRVKYFEYDLLILDWELPGVSGVEICKSYRANGGNKPVLILTGRDGINDKIFGLDTGADDYLTKPFDFRELSSRIKALLRRQQTVVSMVLKAQDLELNPQERSVKRAGVSIELTAREFAILEYMMKHADQVVSPEMILNGVYHSESESTIDSIYTLVKNIRKKLSDKQTLIKTVHGVGYRLNS